jgi:hypothetical protein
MNQFEKRNVLDRIQESFLHIFNTQWKANITPFFILYGLNFLGGVIFTVLWVLIMIPFLRWADFQSFDGIVYSSSVIFLFLLVCTLFYWIVNNLSAITAYLIAKKWNDPFSPFDLIEEAYSHLKKALKFDGYYYSFSAIVFFILFLLFFPIFRDQIWEIRSYWMTVHKEYDIIFLWLKVLFSWALLCIIFALFSLWYSTRYFTQKPGFVLGTSTAFSDFIQWRQITNGYFWTLLGNWLVLFLILTFASSLFQQVLSVFSSWSSPVSSFESEKTTDYGALFFTTFLSTITQSSAIVTILVSSLISYLTNIFRGVFSYVLWKDLTTEFVPPEISKHISDEKKW